MSATKRGRQTSGFTPRWQLEVDGVPVPYQDVRLFNPQFGEVRSSVVIGADGKPNFDRPGYREAPSNVMVVWGLRDSMLYLAIVHQPRPHADDPEQPGQDNHDPVVFGATPMGFIDKLIGEKPDAAARREAGEEAGASESAIIKVEWPDFRHVNAAPAFVESWFTCPFVQVDLDKVEELRPSREEPIYKAEYLPAHVVIRRTVLGSYGGVIYRNGMSMSVLWLFFCHHPELFVMHHDIHIV